MIKASHAIPKRIHKDTVFLYHSGYLREGSIPGGGQDQRMKAWESQGHVPKAEMDTQGLRRTSRIWEVQTVLGLLAWWSTLRLQEASLDWYLGFGN